MVVGEVERIVEQPCSWRSRSSQDEHEKSSCARRE